MGYTTKPYYENGVYVGDYSSAYVDWLEKKRAEEHVEKPAPSYISKKGANTLSGWQAEYFRALWSMSISLINGDLKPIAEFLRTAKSIDEIEANSHEPKT